VISLEVTVRAEPSLPNDSANVTKKLCNSSVRERRLGSVGPDADGVRGTAGAAGCLG